jgi:hypothetical protein
MENRDAGPALPGSLREFHVAVTISATGIISMIRLATAYRRRAADGGAIVLTIHNNRASSDPCQMK